MLNTGIIGTGKVAHLHALALQRNPNSNFTSVLGRSQERTQAFADQYGVKAYTDLEAYIADSGVQASPRHHTSLPQHQPYSCCRE